MEEKNGLLLDVNEKPSTLKWLILAIQHVFAMFGATILVPILVNSAAGTEVLTIPVALVSSGIGTLIYILCTKGKSPVYLGSSFAFIAPFAAAYLKGGISGAMTGVMVVGLIYVVFAILVRLIGKNWINKLLPPVVIGPMIMIIGLGLAPSAVSQIGLTNQEKQIAIVQEITAEMENVDKVDSMRRERQLQVLKEKIEVIENREVKAEKTTLIPTWKVIIVALVSFLVTGIVAVSAKGFFKVIPFLIGIVSGYLAAIAVGIVDFTPIANAAIVDVPNFIIPFIHYTPSLAAVLTIAPIALVTMAEHIGDHTALSAIIGKDLLKKPGLDRTLLGDGLATFIAGAIGGPANTTYGENTSVVGMTKVASVWVIGLAAIIAIILGFFAKFTAVVSTIPNAVLGGVSLLLYGFIAVNGLKVLIQNRVDFGNTKNVIVASAMLVLGLGGAVIAINKGDISVTISGMSLAAIVGILLNLCLPDTEKKNEIKKVEKTHEVEETRVEMKKENIKQEEKLTEKIELNDRPEKIKIEEIKVEKIEKKPVILEEKNKKVGRPRKIKLEEQQEGKKSTTKLKTTNTKKTIEKEPKTSEKVIRAKKKVEEKIEQKAETPKRRGRPRKIQEEIKPKVENQVKRTRKTTIK